ncbi:MAG: type VI secretion system protein TssA [Planctomycetota bacterium]|nr:type VI secretion system protein TssA [Planctomycetota bacterium]
MELRFGQLNELERSRARPESEIPFRIAIFGDFSGRDNRGESADSQQIAEMRPLKPTFESLEDLLGQVVPRLNLPLPDQSTATVEFREFDDFHPDGIHRQVDQVQGLRGDEATALMKAILHSPDFRTVESAWRGLEWLLRRCSKSAQVQIRLYDLSQAEFLADLQNSYDVGQSGILHALTAQQAESEHPWGLVVGLYNFNITVPQIELLGRAALIGYSLNVPFLSSLSAAVTAEDFALDADTKYAWESLQSLPDSAFLGLTVPGFLLRPPFGENYKSVDAFDFEEFGGSHADYLWGNSALLAAALFGRGFIESGWSLTPDKHLQLDSMPLHSYRTGDDDEVAVSTAARFSSLVSERLAAWGLMPVLPVRGRDIIELAAIRAVSTAYPMLAGGWNEGAGVQHAAPVEEPAAEELFATDEAASAAADAELAAMLAEAEGAAPDPATLDPELAALLGETASEPPAELDPELAALLGESTPEVPAEMDPELAALLAEVPAHEEAYAETPAAEEPSEPMPAMELDPELAALLREDFLANSGETPASDPYAADANTESAPTYDQPAEEAPAVDLTTMDPELAALLGDLDQPASSQTDEIPSFDESPSQAPDVDTPEFTDPPADDQPAPAPFELDPELAALLGDTGDSSNAEFDATGMAEELTPDLPIEPPIVDESFAELSGTEYETPAADFESEQDPIAITFEPEPETYREIESPPIVNQSRAVDDTTNSTSTPSVATMATDIADIDELIRQVQDASKYRQSTAGSPPLFDFRELLLPIPGDNPAGESVPFPLREELEIARKEINPESFREDDPMRPTEWVRADWNQIITICRDVLTERSKNLLVAARFLEALTKKYGFAGVRDGLHLIRLLVEVCWDRLEPEIEDDDLEVRAGPFNWLDDPDRGSCYPLTLKQTPVVYAGEDTYSLQQWNLGMDGRSSLSSELVEKAVRITTHEQCKRVAEDITQALNELKWLGQTLRQKMGPDAPGLSAIRPALEECRALAMQIVQKKGPAAGDVLAQETVNEDGTMSASNGQSAKSRLNTREAIYAQLSEAATALQSIEPHSPVPFLVMRAVELGGLPFPQLMAALIRDSSVLSEMRREFGIRSEGEG